MAKRFVELSQPLFNGMPRAKAHGDVKFWVDRLCVNHAAGSLEVCITHVEMAAHVGTHIDAGRHFIFGAPTIDQYPLDRFIGPAGILDVRREGIVPLTADELRKAKPSIQPGDMVLLSPGCTSFDMFRNAEERGEMFRRAVHELQSGREGSGRRG